MLVIFRPPTAEKDRGRLVAEIAECLHQAGRAAALLPHLYFLTPDHEAVAYLRRLAYFTAAAFLRRRAIVWTLRYLGVVAEIEPIDLADFASASASSAVLAEKALPLNKAEAADFGDNAAERWYPVIDAERCCQCRRCYDFCLFGVYALDDSGRVRVAQPDRCKPGCPACARLCPASAIIFPHCPTDQAIAGQDGIASISGQSADAARAFARQSIAAYQARHALAGDALAQLDEIIAEADRRDAEGGWHPHR